MSDLNFGLGSKMNRLPTWDDLDELWVVIQGFGIPQPPELIHLLGTGAEDLLNQARGESDPRKAGQLEKELWSRWENARDQLLAADNLQAEQNQDRQEMPTQPPVQPQPLQPPQ